MIKLCGKSGSKGVTDFHRNCWMKKGQSLDSTPFLQSKIRPVRVYFYMIKNYDIRRSFSGSYIYCLSVADMGRCQKPKYLMFGKCFLLTGFIK